MPLKDYSTTPANNNLEPPNGAPEGMAAADVNNVQRQVMADIKAGVGVVVNTTALMTDLDVTKLADNNIISVSNYSSDGDNGGGNFFYDSGSSATANAGTIFAPDTGTGRFIRIIPGNVNVRMFGAKGDNITDDTTAIQATFDFAKNLTVLLATVEFPNGSYNITSKVTCKDASIRGNGSILISSGNHALLQIEGNNQRYTDLRLQYTSATNNASRLALIFTDGTVQASKNTYVNIVTRNAFRGFNNAGGTGANGSMFGCLFENCRADLSWDWGWFIDGALGMTTLALINCDSAGGPATTGSTQAKGIFINNSSEVSIIDLAVDGVSDGKALEIQNAKTVSADMITLETVSVTTDTSKLIIIEGGNVNLGTITVKAGTLTPGAGNTAFLLSFGATTQTAQVGAIVESGTLSTDGTIKKIRGNGTTIIYSNFVSIDDVDTQGFAENYRDGTKFIGFSGTNPGFSPGVFTRTYKKGDYVLNSSTDLGETSKWVCTVAGTPGTWSPAAVVGVYTSATTPLGDIGDAINTIDKFLGKRVRNVNTSQQLFASGTSAASDWDDADGVAVITPS